MKKVLTFFELNKLNLDVLISWSMRGGEGENYYS